MRPSGSRSVTVAGQAGLLGLPFQRGQVVEGGVQAAAVIEGQPGKDRGSGLGAGAVAGVPSHCAVENQHERSLLRELETQPRRCARVEGQPYPRGAHPRADRCAVRRPRPAVGRGLGAGRAPVGAAGDPVRVGGRGLDFPWASGHRLRPVRRNSILGLARAPRPPASQRSNQAASDGGQDGREPGRHTITLEQQHHPGDPSDHELDSKRCNHDYVDPPLRAAEIVTVHGGLSQIVVSCERSAAYRSSAPSVEITRFGACR